METRSPFDAALSEWRTARCLTKRPKTVAFYHDTARFIRREWPAAQNLPLGDISAAHVLELGQRLAHLCPSQWNSVVSAMRALTPHGRLLPRRPMRIREFNPPTQAQFSALLAECDRMKRTKAGLIVRFLCLTGLRKGEAYALTWSDVGQDCIRVPAASAKNGRARSVPMVAGVREVLERLRTLAGASRFVLPQENCRKALETASRRAFGVRWSFHLCRHFFATSCVTSGVDLPTVARWMGHLDGGGLLARTYYHLADGHSQAMAQRVCIVAPEFLAGERIEACLQF